MTYCIVRKLREHADKHGLMHFEISAKRNTNLNELFLTLAKKIPEKAHAADTKVRYPGLLGFTCF